MNKNSKFQVLSETFRNDLDETVKFLLSFYYTVRENP